METNRNYRRLASTARLDQTYFFGSAKSLLSSLTDSKGKLIPYRCNSLDKCLKNLINKFYPGFNIEPVVEFYFADFLSGYVDILRTEFNISSIDFYSNGDIKLHFFSYEYKCS